ncbi:MAG TPA: hypothetical protein DEP46_03350 [Blastocatellia bacterium]|nr:hypothetical protein [Blastocatellia bacterium]
MERAMGRSNESLRETTFRVNIAPPRRSAEKADFSKKKALKKYFQKGWFWCLLGLTSGRGISIVKFALKLIISGQTATAVI